MKCDNCALVSCPQLFLRDCEQLEAATGAQEAFLSNDDLGVSAETDIQGLILVYSALHSTNSM